MQTILVAGMVIGVVEFLRRLEKKDWLAMVTIFAAALVGGLAGYFGVEGLTISSGIVAGLSASGLCTIATRIGE